MDDAVIRLLSLERTSVGPARERAKLITSFGDITCLHHVAAGDAAVLWVPGASGGSGGPAGGLYTRLGAQISRCGVTSLALDYRQPGLLANCAMDVLTALSWLEQLGKSRVALVGHSFGGAVAISAGAISPLVAGVAAFSCQTAGTAAVAQLSPRPFLLVHGLADELLPAVCAQDLYGRALQPKQMILYPECGHDLDQCADELDRDLREWLGKVLAVTDLNVDQP
jgi:pimeloyl-ACP methyl ester carboxylesterase